MSLGRIYTLAEAAEHLRMTNRGVAKIARKHGLCMVNGRVITFTEGDIEGIKQSLRPLPSEPRRTAVTPALSDYQLHKSLVKLTGRKKRRA